MKFFKKTIEPKIATAVSAVLHAKVFSTHRMTYGEINYVCAVITDRGKFIVRIFGYKDKPEPGKLEWIEKQLVKHRISHAKLIYYSRSSKYFPYGFMISEFVDGLGGWEAIKQGKQTLAQSYISTGSILRKIHNIKLKKFSQGNGDYSDFLAMEIKSVRAKLKDLISKKVIDDKPVKETIAAIKDSLEPYNKTFRPVLLHADASRENSILTKDDRFILVDWDNAWSGIWLWDYIEMSWWWLFPPVWTPAKKRIAKKAFFKGYGKITLTPKAFNDIERGLHLIKSVEKLHYYYFDRKEIKNFRIVKKILFKILSSNDPSKD